MVAVIEGMRLVGKRIAAEGERARGGFEAAKELERELEKVLRAVGTYGFATAQVERARMLLNLRLQMRVLAFEVARREVIEPLAVAQRLATMGLWEVAQMPKERLNKEIEGALEAVAVEVPEGLLEEN